MYEYHAFVNRVIDGDTVEVTVDLGFSLAWTTPVRLFGINAAESNSKSPVERAAAMLAKSYLSTHIADKTVLVKTVKPKDKYGRYLAEIYLVGEGLQTKSVNQAMIDLELVKPWDGNGEKPV